MTEGLWLERGNLSFALVLPCLNTAPTAKRRFEMHSLKSRAFLIVEKIEISLLIVKYMFRKLSFSSVLDLPDQLFPLL
jgi:hypothetical protein